jgi:hypothetical protein
MKKIAKRIAKSAFDRDAGKPVSSKQLRTYQEALAQYHLRPEDKFLNGDYREVQVGPIGQRREGGTAYGTARVFPSNA